jgi:tetratricopeptide (TPR) repeat protein
VSLQIQRGILAATCVLVIGVYAYTARSGYVASRSLNPADAYYNLLVQGFRAGQLNLKVDVPPGLAQLADPYDPNAHAPYREVDDMSYYKGKLYLYFGVTPAVALFWPYASLTGHYLLQKDAGVIFCAIGFLASACLLYAIWRRYFVDVHMAVIAASLVALGLATCTPLLLARCDVYEVSISCAYAFVMLSLAAIWKALHSRRRCRWLAAASLAYGLAVGARPSLLFGAVILLAPVALEWRRRQKLWVPLLAATVPITLIGLGLMLYNWLRFGNPFEFGLRYQLTGDPLLVRQALSLRYFWFNFRVYFLKFAHWSGRFPFVHHVAFPPVPAGHIGADEQTFGILTNLPLVWLALAVPLAWRGRSADERATLSGFLAMAAVFFGIVALTMSLFFAAFARYQVDFLPELVLLSVIGILSLERVFASELFRRRALRWVYGFLLAFSVAFNLLTSVVRSAEAHNNLGVTLLDSGRLQEARGQFEQALRIKPDFAEAHNNLGGILQASGQLQDARGQFEEALRIRPRYAQPHNNLGRILAAQGRTDEAIDHYEQAVRIQPSYARAHNNLAIALVQVGRTQEAVDHYEQALRIKPDFSDAHYDLGVAYLRLGRVQDAISQWQQTVQLQPDRVDAQYNLGLTLEKMGRTTEAIEHYQQALRIKPDLAAASNALARLKASAQKGS